MTTSGIRGRRPIRLALGLLSAALIGASPSGRAAEWLVYAPTQEDYVPSRLTVRVGDTVTWINNGAVLHEVRFRGNPLGADQPNPQRLLKRGQRLSLVFTIPGKYPYYCKWHGMHSVVEVVP